jgi:pantoate--beta-alanine ligase
MIELKLINEIRAAVQEWQAKGQSVGVVMTMGALHQGHVSLVDAARGECDRVVATVFINPLQFGPAEDYESYPRTELADLKLLAEAGCDAAFLPSATTIFPGGERHPEDSRTLVEVRGLTDVLCGQFRRGHFVGMSTEVLKMLNIIGANAAYFGEKDYQQYLVIRAMVDDLCLPTRVVVCPTLREPDGVAMGSRNAYLTSAQRSVAPQLYRVLCRTAKQIGRRDTQSLIADATGDLLASGFDAVEYVDIRDGALRAPGPGCDAGSLRVFGAAHLGLARLIDNVAAEGER